MKNTLIRISTTVVTVLSLLLTLSSISVFAQSGFNIELIAKPHTKLKEVGKGRLFKNSLGSLSGIQALNNQGELTVFSEVGGDCFYGAYLISNGKVTPLGDYFCNPSPLGQFSLFHSANINDSGQTVILGRVDHSFQAMFLYENGKLNTLAKEGDPTPINTAFKSILGSISSIGPTINNQGEIAFAAETVDKDGQRQDGIFTYADGVFHKVVADGDPSPLFGTFGGLINIPQPARINNKSEVLFYASSTSDDGKNISYGFFLATPEGIKKVVANFDPLPNGNTFFTATNIPDLNDKSEVVFTAGTRGFGEYTPGLFLWSEGEINKIILDGEPTPIGGTFELNSVYDSYVPRINNNGTIAVLLPVKGGRSPSAIFLASKKAVLKVAAVGDRLPTGEKITFINSFAQNDIGQVAFVAFTNKYKPAGAFIATPANPQSDKIELVSRNGVSELQITGSGFITNDTTIEINGVVLDSLSYPQDFREDGGTTRQVISRDPRLEQLLQPGQAAQITVFNSLTNRRSEPKAFAR